MATGVLGQVGDVYRSRDQGKNKENPQRNRRVELFLHIEEKSALPFYRRLGDALKAAILEGRLKPGDELPSVRELAERYGVARVTVLRAYHELRNQGYVEAVRGSATRVSMGLHQSVLRTPKVAAPSVVARTKFVKRLDLIKEQLDLDADSFPELNFGIPTSELLPVVQWRRLLAEHCSEANRDILRYHNDPRGLLRLRQALVDYLARSRAVRCVADQIFVFAGLQHALHMLGRLTLEAGDAVAIENPGHIAARRVFQLQNFEVHPVPVDDDGLRVDALPEQIKLLYTTPSHQFPLGCALSLERRLQLLAWAHENSAWIVENDNDSEFRYGRQPLPALQGLDRNDCVVYIQTFWKTLGPMVRMGFAVVPERLVPLFLDAKTIIEPDFPALEQSVLAEFIETGLYERHIASMRKTYAGRRQALVQSLTRAFGKDVRISKETAGTFAIVRFLRALPKAAAQAAFPLVSTGAFYVPGTEAESGEYLIPFAHRTESEIITSVEIFAQQVRAAQER